MEVNFKWIIYQEVGIDVPADSGLGLLEKAKAQWMLQKQIEDDPDTPRFTIDYRQKPDGIKNYSMMELRVKNELEDREEWEALLMPEDEEKAHLYLKGTKSESEPKLEDKEDPKQIS